MRSKLFSKKCQNTICLFHYVHICTNGAKAMAGETASSLVPLAGIKTVVTNCSGKSLILHYHVLTLQNKRQKKHFHLTVSLRKQ